VQNCINEGIYQLHKWLSKYNSDKQTTGFGRFT